VTEPDSQTTTTPAGWFRPDVDGLRAVAILLVVLFHAGIDRFEGGFVGVNVFSVISGWLIPRNILRESETTGRLDLARFWARRVRRLVPGLVVVVIATMIGSVVILSSLEIDQVAKEGLAAAFYVSNIVFAEDSAGYFSTDVSESPFLHTWSLGIEEQFYLSWPLLVAGAVFVTRRNPDRLRVTLGTTFAFLLVGSFLISRALTDAGSTWAFFGLPSRVWEFAAAGLLAMIPLPRLLAGPVTRTVLGTGGLVAIIIAALTLSSATPYPGTAAMLPVFGTLAVLASADPMGGAATIPPTARALATAPMQWIGRLSYSWYLWHWPVVILGQVAFNRDDAVFGTAAIIAALLPAWVSYRFVEQPIRFNWSFVKPNRRALLAGVAATIVAGLVVFGLGRAVDSLPASPIDEQLAEARDADALFPDCDLALTDGGVAYCGAGADPAGRSVFLYGDSKAWGWFNPLVGVATDNELRVVARFFPGCPATTIDVEIADGSGSAPEVCQVWRDDSLRLVDELRPDVVVVSQGSLYLSIGEVLGGLSVEAQAEAWGLALAKLVDDIRAAGSEIVLLLDNPAYNDDPTICVAREGSSAACAVPRDDALDRISTLREQELTVVDRLNVAVLDLVDELCDDDTCAVGTGRYIHYADTNHLSLPSMVAMAGKLETLILDALGR